MKKVKTKKKVKVAKIAVSFFVDKKMMAFIKSIKKQSKFKSISETVRHCIETYP